MKARPPLGLRYAMRFSACTALRLAEELEDALRQHVRLREHRLSSLHEDVVLRVRHHLRSDVGIADRGLGVLADAVDAQRGGVAVADGNLQLVVAVRRDRR